ncbi:DUF3348 domain-containing protein [Actimicrobium sp. CCC2.4]|uniref:DUF3348 domain-containing protein n=1 Tax=Actimicrobium sp. CCC2.4 TaxID=3048606 RepID=UPI002AC8A10A|nr:DUF3348 domain-containing protein [Actimicrobium sp. CCC2.4]MEB0134506.1 DUF3348 domain-containing protein [Actimicrobium sp. CCC2.4]WPX33952.1 DUF3348 domain-containing protein [Actimicrobium sp. CCC2.4]
MTRALPRTNFHSSTLIRCLARLEMVGTLEQENAFAEKLGLWIHFADAITLSAVHSDITAPMPMPFMPAAAQINLSTAIAVEFDRTQTGLINSIIANCSPKSGKSLIKLPIPLLELPIDIAAAYAPYRWFYDAHQRDMEMRVQPLRTKIRNALANVSPRLKKLADLDAALEAILREREGKLLSKIPVLLKIRFEQLFKVHQQRLVESREADNPAAWIHPTGWLTQFCNDMQMLLLFELELRLQPTVGLIEAFDTKTNNE